MIKIQNNHSGLVWPDEKFELKMGVSEYEDPSPKLLERLKAMHDDKLIVLEIPGFRHINGAWVPTESTPSIIEHAPTAAAPDASTTGKGGAASGARMIDDKNIAPPGKPTDQAPSQKQ